MKKPTITKADVEQLFYMKPGDPNFYWKRYRNTTERKAGKSGDGKYWVKIGTARYSIGELVWAVVHGESPEYGVVYKDGDAGNWKISNLAEKDPPGRESTPAERAKRLADRLEKNGFPVAICTGIREVGTIVEEVDRTRLALSNMEHQLGQFRNILEKLQTTLMEARKLA